MAYSPEKNGWKECYTLSKRTKFCWIFNHPESTLYVKRELKGIPKRERKDVTGDQLNKIYSYVCDNPGTGLGNSVSIKDQEGIGKFMEREFGWDSTDAQLASHIATLYVKSEAWKLIDSKRKTKRGMQFEVNPEETNWRKCLKEFYDKSPDCDGL